jgi:uncharacterized repeat protein (TIGR01451 family)
MKSTGRSTQRGARARRVVLPLHCEWIERRLLLSTYVVTNSNDDGSANSLRWAIQQVDADTTPDTIDFNIPGGGSPIIALRSPLPALTNSVVIDGTTQPGYGTSPLVVIDGSNLPSGSNGFTLSGGASTIRGLAIVGFSGSGVLLNSAGNTVESSFIGVGPSGTSAVANGTGISIAGWSANTIGGSTAGAGNLISGNAGAGISISGTTSDPGTNFVFGNDIGTIAGGLAPLGNGQAGVLISGASQDQIGGSGAAGNVISGNTGPGIQLVSGASGTSIYNNVIGVGSDNATPVGNGSDGIQVVNSPNTQIGGVLAGQGNVIGCNSGNGISASGSSTGMLVEGNAIGTDLTASRHLGNAKNGVYLAASSDSIGASSADAGNHIYYNGDGSVGAGVLLVGNVVHNTILSNSIYGNAYLGINLGSGPTDNHAPGTPGPNDYQNYPVLSVAESDGTSTTIKGTLTSIPSTSFLVQFFGSPTEDSTGYGQGKNLLGSAMVLTDANGYATFSTGFSLGTLAGQYMTATATSPSGDTSEFGLDIVTQGQVNLQLSGAATPSPALAGGQETYKLSVANKGDITAHQVALTDQLPTGVTIASATTTQGLIVPSTNGSTLQVEIGTLIAGAEATVTIVVNLPPNTTGTITDTASVSSQEADPDPSDEEVTLTTNVELAADVSIAMTASPEPVLEGGDLTYTMTVDDSGPAPASDVIVTLPVAVGASYVSASSPVGTIGYANGEVTASLGNLALNSPVTLTVVLQAETAGMLSETATVSSDDIDPNSGDNQVTVTSQVNPASDLAVALAASGSAAAATVDLTYTVTATNNGPADDSSVTLNDTLPTAATLVSVSAQGGLTPTIQNGVVTLAIGNFAAGASETLTIVVDPTGAAGTSLSDSAAITGQLPDPSPNNDAATLTLPVRGISDLGIAAVASPASVPVGQPLTFTLTVTNAGPANEPDAVVTSQLPTDVSVVSAAATQGQAPVVDKNGVLNADLGALAASDSATVTLIVVPQLASVGTLSDTFAVAGQNVDSNPGNNSVASTVTVVPATDLSVQISPSVGPAYDQADWSYSVVVGNAGPSPATDVTAVAQLPGNVQIVSASSSQGATPVIGNGTVTAAVGSLAVDGAATITLVVQPLFVGLMELGASVSGAEADPNQSNSAETISVPVQPSVSLATQLVPSSPTIQTGHSLTMTATIDNTGPCEATNVAVSLPLPTGLAYVSATASQGTFGLVSGQFVAQLGNLAPGAGATVNVIVTPTIAGQILATASATATQFQLNPQTNSATAYVTAVESPGVLQFSSAAYSVSELAGSAVLTVTRADGSLGAVSVGYQTTPVNATPGIDYVPISGQLFFATGQTTAIVQVRVLDDPWESHDEYVNVSLSAPGGGAILGANSTANLRIVDVSPDPLPFTVSQLSWRGSSQWISSLEVSFSAPVVASLAANSGNYRLFNMSAGGSAMSIGTAVYTQVRSSNTFTVTLYPTVPLVSGRTYEIIVVGAGATAIRDDAGVALQGSNTLQPGTNYVATFEQGTKLQYFDGARNSVTLSIKGPGYLEQVRDAYGNGQVLTVVGEVPGRTMLSGSIKRAKGSNGRTMLGIINGLGAFGNVRVKMTSPPFMLRQFPFERSGHGVL